MLSIRRRGILPAIAVILLVTGCVQLNQDTDNLSLSAELKKNVVNSFDDHPITLWEKSIPDSKGSILFVHGRTWSALPDFDLQVEGEDLSLMDGMVEQGYSTYAIDLRGYGDTPRDASEWNTPNKAAKDIQAALAWISEENNDQPVHLFGWSMGSTHSLLSTQMDDQLISTLTLFGFWMDIDQKASANVVNAEPIKAATTAEAAASDFIIPGSISQKAIDRYVEMALEADPVRVDYTDMSDYNIIDPALIEVPVLIIQGEKDPIAPTERQAKLFTRLKTADKSWSVIKGGDHAAFLESPRPQFIKVYSDFLERF